MTNKSLRDYINLIESNKQGVAEGSTQEYTAKVIDSKNKSYTVKVSAPSEEGAKHMAVVKVRKEYGVKPEAVIIMNQGVAEGSYDNDPGIKHTRGS